MPDATNKFKCKMIKCSHWFTLQQARTEKLNNGTALNIYCPKCGGYVEKIQRVLDGRGINLEPRDVVHPIPADRPAPPPPKNSIPSVRLKYIIETTFPPAPPKRGGQSQARKPCGMGQGDKIPLMQRYISGSRDIAGTFASSTRKPSKKRVTKEWDY